MPACPRNTISNRKRQPTHAQLHKQNRARNDSIRSNNKPVGTAWPKNLLIRRREPKTKYSTTSLGPHPWPGQLAGHSQWIGCQSRRAQRNPYQRMFQNFWIQVWTNFKPRTGLPGIRRATYQLHHKIANQKFGPWFFFVVGKSRPCPCQRASCVSLSL